MATQVFGLNETMKVHELLTLKNVAMTKSTTMQVLVSDGKLRSLLQTCADLDRQHIGDLQALLSNASVVAEHQEALQK